MTEYRAFVGYNKRTGAFNGYNSGDEFDWVYSDTFEPTESPLVEKCELLYDRLNRHEELPEQRTMSVGDCVVFVRQSGSERTVLAAYSCESIGWDARREIARLWSQNFLLREIAGP